MKGKKFDKTKPSEVLEQDIKRVFRQVPLVVFGESRSKSRELLNAESNRRSKQTAAAVATA